MKGFSIIILVLLLAICYRSELVEFKKSCFLCLFFFYFYGSSTGYSQVINAPEYEWENMVDLGSASVFNLENIVVSTDTDSQGFVYVLTFGGDLIKFGPDGSSVDDFQLKTDTEGPVDFAINSKDEIYVADHESRTVFAFDTNGNRLSAKDKDSDHFKPLGVTFDLDDNLYVLDYNDGTGGESDISSRLKIYYSTGGESGNLLMDELSQPYRIGVNSEGTIYISQAGSNGKGEVVVFSKNMEPITTLEGLGAPGSVVVDVFDYVHVIDYFDRLNFSKILDRDESYLFGAISGIQEGISNNRFSIRIFNPDNILVDTFKDHLDLPLDIAFGYCSSNMYTLDSQISPTYSLVFNLEIYNRTPSFDTEAPVAVCIPAGKEFTLVDGEVTIPVEAIDDGSSDNCAFNMSVFPSTFTSPGEKTVELRVTDTGGNTDSCTTTIYVTAPEAELEITCPGTQTGEVNGNCEFEIPDYTGLVKSNGTLTQSPAPGSTVSAETTIVMTASLDGETTSCTFSLQVGDTTAPEIDCPPDMEVNYDSSEGFVLENYASLAQIDDNCGEVIVTQSPDSGTIIFGDTKIHLTATDASGRTDACFFTITLIDQTPKFICPDPADFSPLELNAECKVEAPDFNIADPQNFSEGPFVVQTEFQDGTGLHVRLEVYDGEGGEFVGECNFIIPLVDTTPPQIDCPSNPVNISPNENGVYILPDFSDRASDSCDSTPNIVQNPPPGEITQSGSVSLSATDDSGNTSEICSFEVVLLQEGEPSFECPTPEELPILELDEDCVYETPDFNSLFSNFQNFENAPVFVQNTEQLGTVLRVVIRVYDGAEEAELLVGTCEFHVTLIENHPPRAECRSAITIKLGADGTRTISPEEVDNGSTDNCGGLFSSLSRDTFTTADLEGSPVEVMLTVSDTFGNTDTCTVAVTVEPYNPEEPEIVCISSLTLPLDENGEAYIDVDQLYEGDLGPGGIVSVDKDFFTCEDLGQHTIFLDYSGDFSAGGCSIIVNVVDEIAPVPIVSILEIALGENGTASISAEDIDNGSTDNCTQSGLQYSLSQTVFNCSDRGVNNIEFTVTDVSGNSATAMATVTVNDPGENCLVVPEPPGDRDFVLLLPNPSRGLFQIAASPSIEIQRVEVFDMRGRYMGTYEMTLNPGKHSYSLDLQQYQTGVYTLRIIADDGEYIRRAIISTF